MIRSLRKIGYAIFLCSLSVTIACNNPEKKNDASPGPVPKFDDKQSIDFFKQTSEHNILQIEVARLAQQRVRNKRLKMYARQMIADNTRIYNDLKKLAEQKHLLLPIDLTRSQADSLEEMKKLNTRKFEREYIRMLLRESNNQRLILGKGVFSNDSIIRQFSNKTLPLIRSNIKELRSFDSVYFKSYQKQ